MNESKDTPKTGGPAFPQPSRPADPGASNDESGMSMRDYFAAHAPKPHDAWISSTAARTGKTIDEVLALHAYAYADRMLDVRDAANTTHGGEI